jgi:hypothetical protein
MAIDENDVRKVVERNDKYLLKLQKDHVKMVEGSVRKLQSKILNQLTNLRTNTSGKVEGIRLNLKNLQKIHKRVEIIFDDDFSTAIKKQIADFSKITGLIQRSYRDLNEAVKFTDIDREATEVLKTGVWRDFTALGDTKKEKVIQSMYDMVIAGGDFSDLVAAIESNIMGGITGTGAGRSLLSYSTTYANDAVMNFHNQVNLTKAEDAGFTDFLYVGDIIETTRDFCAARAGKVYSKKEIDSWTFSWKGKSGPAFTHRGGYNCRHHWQAVRKEWLGGKDKIEIQNWNLEKREGG